MADSDGLSRRAVLASAPALLSAIAGCAESDTDEDGAGPTTTDPDESPTTSATATPASESPTQSPGTDTDDSASDTDSSPTATDTDSGSGLDALDEREANVVDVAFERQNGSVAFDVTLFHDDDGEDGYANWWQVERLNGEQLGRRELLHAHSQQPFTRSETISIPDDVACVVVRGHDQTHGYGGQAMLTNLDSGATRTANQGQEPQSFTESDCQS